MTGNLGKHVRKALVVGGGVGGPAAAIRMAEAGVAVDLVDIATDWGAPGTGLTLSPLTTRALCDLGLAEALVAEGEMYDTLALFGADGQRITQVRSPRLHSPDVPAEGGILRPVLHGIMARRMAALGVDVRTGTGVETMAQDDDGVTVAFTDGRSGRYDLVIGADGIDSALRDSVIAHAPRPRYTGQFCWRAELDRPAGWDGGRAYFGPLQVGFTPLSPTRMHMFLLETVAEEAERSEDGVADRLRGLLEGFGGPVAEIRAGLRNDGGILAWPVRSLLVDGDWYDGRVVLIGDAVHAPTPHLSSGAGLAVEDAVVLVEALDAAPDIAQGLAAFMARRLPRARQIVNGSVKLGELERAGASSEEMADLMFAALQSSADPY